jgi:hypothetical protein
MVLNIGGFNDPIKNQRLSNWINKTDSFVCNLQDMHFKHENTGKLKVKT